MREPSAPRTLLVVDDDEPLRNLLIKGLATDTLRVICAANGEQALVALRSHEVDVVVTDMRMPGLSGLELCRTIVQQNRELPVIVFTAFGDYDSAVEAIRAGAYDFLAKPVRLDVLALSVERALSHAQLRHEVRRLRDASPETAPDGEVLGECSAMRVLLDLVQRVAPLESSVLITGESGTGKELIARRLHQQSDRSAGPFVPVNCAAVPEQLLESELFGYQRGSFTSANSSHVGLFVQAHGGTLFLDEIGELPVALQPKILRAIQERTVRPLGGKRDMELDVRIVAATNRDLEQAMRDGQFREDLFFRLNVIEIALPPLRARGNDVLLLAQHFVVTFAKRNKRAVVGMTPDAAAQLVRYSWPGNVRELANVMERAVALTNQDHIGVMDLPERVANAEPSRALSGDDPSQFVPLEQMEKDYILRVLDCVGGNRSEAARILGLDRSTLWRKLERYSK